MICINTTSKSPDIMHFKKMKLNKLKISKDKSHKNKLLMKDIKKI